MLILAGVSINAIIGDDGIISRTQYSTFLSEMTAVEEAVQMWKAGEVIGQMGEDTKAIPANGLCAVNDLTSTNRLVGEVGYYRIWSMTEKEPTTSIFSSSNELNSEFESEMIFFPAGVQDLYYLNNEALGIKSDKTYVIDAANGMIYSLKGITLKGVSCYSSNMATSVMSGTSNAPVFAESEVSGTGIEDEKLAGNVQDEFLENGNKNPNYNPYGFKFISSIKSNNIYKLYNNGDLYGKGVKSTALNCTPEELRNISQYNWNKLSISSELDKYKKIFLARLAIFMIDQNDEVWAYGNNSNDKLGLTSEQKKEFTGREPIKLDLKDSEGNMLKIDSIYGDGEVTFFVTTDNKVYGVGRNTTSGSLGINSNENIISDFTITQGLPNKKIKKISCSGVYGDNETTVVLFEDGDIYEAGYSIGLQTKNNLTFVKSITKEDIVNKFPSRKIVDIAISSNTIMAILDNKDLIMIRNNNIEKLEDFSNIKYVQKIYASSWIIIDNNQNIYLYEGLSNYTIERDFGLENIELKDISGSYKTYIKLNDYFPTDMKINNDYVKDVRCTASGSTGFCMVYIMNSGRVFASGQAENAGVGFDYYNNMLNHRLMISCIIGDNKVNGISNLNNVKINGFTSNKVFYTGDKFFNPLLISESGDIYTTGNTNLMYGNDILEKSWKKIAANVKECWINGDDNIGYIDRENNGYVALSNFEHFGVESLSEVMPNTCFRKIINTANEKNLEGKVKKIVFDSGSSWVITTDNELYVGSVGKYDSSWVNSAYNGLGGEKLTKLTKVIDNVQHVASYFGGVIVVTNDKTYYTGALYGQGTGLNKNSIGATVSGNSVYFENITNFNISGLDIPKIKKWKHRWEESAVLLEDGNMWFGGYRSSRNTLGFGKNILSYCSWEELGLDGPVVDFAECNESYDSYIVLTDKGSLYGTGPRKILGDGSGSNDSLSMFTKLNLPNEDNSSKIIAINGLANSYVATRSDGSVWGTGNNTYGILGRWIGIGRGESNSRYKTALNWVECPELEI